MQAAGFALPTVDTEVLTIRYPDAWTLWHHLRAMGDSNGTLQRSTADPGSRIRFHTTSSVCDGSGRQRLASKKAIAPGLPPCSRERGAKIS